MHRSIHRTLAAAAALPLALGVVSMTADSAAAVTVHPDTCTHPGFRQADRTDGRNIVDNTPVRTGPWAACSLASHPLMLGTRLHYDCFVTNGNGFRWTHVNIVDTVVSGWVINGNLSGGGSSVPC